jgi:ABC-2 type transport system ATP-binding protein/lipopolysaccharide transport system ATP-binding protein
MSDIAVSRDVEGVLSQPALRVAEGTKDAEAPLVLAEPQVESVRLESVSVRYRVPRERFSGLKELAVRWAQGRLETFDVWALHDVSLSLRAGEIFGVVGVNGAGKTTLLKAIAGVLHPTEGRIWVQGSVAPLLELGAGFHPELTGRENVFLYGTLLGNSRRHLRGVYDSIVEFAELDSFMDAPLRTYSSGMAARLAFAVATHRRADVLLVDEVLAVGDVHFQEKCRRRMDEFRTEGATIVLVSHDPGLLTKMCDRVAWLEGGRVAALGPADEIVGRYVAAG